MNEKKQTFFQKLAYEADFYRDPDANLNTSQRIIGGIASSIEGATLGKMGVIGRAISTSFRGNNYGLGKEETKRRKKEKEEKESSDSEETAGAGGTRASGEIIGDNVVSAIESSKNSIVLELKNLGNSFRSGLQSINTGLKSQSSLLDKMNDYSEDSYLTLENIYELLSEMKNSMEESSGETTRSTTTPTRLMPPKEEEQKGLLESLLGSIGGFGGARGAGGTRGARGARGATPRPTGSPVTGAAGKAAAGKAGGSMLGRAAGTVGKRIPLVGGVVSGGLEYAESGNILKSLFVGGGSALGAIGGGILGTAAGPVGTAAGGIAGGMVGAEAGGGLYDYLFGSSDKEKNKENLNSTTLTPPETVSRETKNGEQISDKTDYSADSLSFSAGGTINYEAKEIRFKADKIFMPGLATKQQSRVPTRIEEQKEASTIEKLSNMTEAGKSDSGIIQPKQNESFFSSLASTISSAFGYQSETRPPSYGFAKAGAGSSISPNQAASASTIKNAGQIKNVLVSRGVDTRVNKTLSDKVSSLQASFGKKLTVTSGFRDPARNKRVGGASNSAHTRGNAVDVRFDGGVEETIKFINLASKAGVGGIGVYQPGLVHLDTENKRAWGPNYHYDSVPEWAKQAIDAHLGKKGSSPQETMMASGGERSSAKIDTSTPSESSMKGSSSMVSAVSPNPVSSLSSETSLASMAPPPARSGGNIFNNISGASGQTQLAERISSKSPLPAIDDMFKRLFDSSGFF